MSQEVSIGVVAAEFNKPLVEAMIDAARDEARRHGAVIVEEARVPGCYEIPLAADVLLARPDVAAAVVLGYIERGETLHGEVMGQAVHATLLQIELARRKPIGIGIIGPGADAEQAEGRKASYAWAAVRAALASLGTLRRLSPA
jgi:6,7-dimethyl-8-ribityllumazine synthase